MIIRKIKLLIRKENAIWKLRMMFSKSIGFLLKEMNSMYTRTRMNPNIVWCIVLWEPSFQKCKKSISQTQKSRFFQLKFLCHQISQESYSSLLLKNSKHGFKFSKRLLVTQIFSITMKLIKALPRANSGWLNLLSIRRLGSM
jgi:hypothetical protein